ncbi:hypothetical protein TWF718_005703 [Orbilia javanica]|uniref:Uncharacterized protein n=1 Tax=Orbilia javanica TaxID=47235 RepID=A0AAN8MQB3_9PEZI
MNMYDQPSSRDILFQNFRRFQEYTLKAEVELSKVYKAVRTEAECAIEFYHEKKRFDEVSGLLAILRDTLESYKTADIHEKMIRPGDSEPSGRLFPFEKKSGRLFRVIKSSTFLVDFGCKYLSIEDFNKAEQHLSDLVKRLGLQPFLNGIHGEQSSTTIEGPWLAGRVPTDCYHTIDPLWHRALALIERGKVAEEFLPDTIRRSIGQNNLLGETGLHVVLRNKFPTVPDRIFSEISENQDLYRYLDFTDIRGMNPCQAAVLYKSLSALHPKFQRQEIQNLLNRKCFLSGEEILGPKSNYFNTTSMSHIDIHQLGAIVGDPQCVHDLGDLFPVPESRDISSSIGISYTGSPDKLRFRASPAHLRPDIDIGCLPPVVVAAVCQNFSIIPQILMLPGGDLANISTKDLFGLNILAFRSDQEELLSWLTGPTQRLGIEDLLTLMRFALMAATPATLRKWFEITLLGGVDADKYTPYIGAISHKATEILCRRCQSQPNGSEEQEIMKIHGEILGKAQLEGLRCPCEGCAAYDASLESSYE